MRVGVLRSLLQPPSARLRAEARLGSSRRTVQWLPLLSEERQLFSDQLETPPTGGDGGQDVLLSHSPSIGRCC